MAHFDDKQLSAILKSAILPGKRERERERENFVYELLVLLLLRRDCQQSASKPNQLRVGFEYCHILTNIGEARNASDPPISMSHPMRKYSNDEYPHSCLCLTNRLTCNRKRGSKRQWRQRQAARAGRMWCRVQRLCSSRKASRKSGKLRRRHVKK